jgi:hypothetical protein
MLKKISVFFLFLIVSPVFFYSNAKALSLRLYGGGGFESLNIDEEGYKDDSFIGYSVSGIANVGFFDTIPGFSLFAGGGIRQLATKLEGTIYGFKSSLKFSSTLAVVEGGAEFSMIPLLRLQALGTYEYALNGKVETSAEGIDPTTNNPLKITTNNDIDKFARFGLGARALLTVMPFLSVGLEPTYYMNLKLKLKDLSLNVKNTDANGSGYAIKGLVAFVF